LGKPRECTNAMIPSGTKNPANMPFRTKIPQIGESIPRWDAPDKVTGRVLYSSDHYGDGLLWAGAKRAPIPHGRIKAIHVENAKAVSGVVAVLTHNDVKGTNRQGVIQKDQPVLADQTVRHRGDAVALVVALDREILAKAIDLITLDMEPLEAVFDVEEAMKPGGVLVHEGRPERNCLLKGEIETGDGAKALEACDVVVEAVFRLPWQEHAYLETESGWAIFRADGRLEIVASTQTPFRDRSEVAEALGLETGQVRIIAPYCGGAFGGKDGITVQSLLGLAALHCPGRPVKMWLNREESFLSSSKRHPARLYYRLGAMADGTFHALEARVVYDTGPYDHLGGAVMALGLEHAGGPYRIPNTSLKAWAVYTNNPVGGAFRGFGVPQVAAAMEQTVDMLASRLSISPLDLRLQNGVMRGDRNPVGGTIGGSTGLSQCLEKIKQSRLWTNREDWKRSAGPFKRRGVGVACAMHGVGYGPVVPDVANAKIELSREGNFRIFSGIVDMGQGNSATYLQIAGDLLNQDVSQLELVLPDTDRTLPSGSASASRTTYAFGNALIGACEVLMSRLMEKTADLLMEGGPTELALLPGCVRHLPTGKEIPLTRIAEALDPAERIAVFRFRAPVSHEGITKDPVLRIHGIPHLIFSYGAHLACVEADELTGVVEVKRYLAVSDCGRILNPQTFEQQIHGAVAQGLGYALCEDFIVERGMVKSEDLATYIIPGALDVPDMHSMVVECPEHTGPFGLKGAGEIAMDVPLPAIANALCDATGIRVFSPPITPERVLDAMAGKQSGEKEP
jgi:CO/xanthine dehydrogenase Mo-binding subunit